MILTTTPSVEGRSIAEYKGIVFGEVISGVDVIKDFTAGLSNFFGGRSATYEDELTSAREQALQELEQRAARSGYQLHHTPRVGQALAAKARSAYGARELRRAVDRAVEQALADQIASGTACVGQHWTADCSADGAIVLREDETATL